MSKYTTPQQDDDREALVMWAFGIAAVLTVHLALALSATGIAATNIWLTLNVILRLFTGQAMPEGVVLGTITSFVIWFMVIGAGIIALVLVARWAWRKVFGGGNSDDGLATAAMFTELARTVSSAALPFAFIGKKPIYDTAEDSGMILAPSGAGKTTRVVLQVIKRAEGPCVTTSTKPDVLRLTAGFRRKLGTIWVFDPENVSNWPTKCRWNIVAGCEDEMNAMRRAKAIVAARPLDGDSKNSGFFATAAQVILRCMLHAAAVGGYTMRDVIAWTRDFSDDTPYTVLRTNPHAIRSWHDDLKKFCRGEATETVSSTEQTLSGILEAFAIEAILDSVCPGDGVSFDPDTFHGTKDTMYLLSQSGDSSLAAPVITALVESIQSAANAAATRTESGVLTPALTNMLDEVANVCPLPALPSYMSDGRGHGLKTWVVAQDRPQLVKRFGREGANTIINQASVLLLLGGSKDNDHLRELSDLADEREVERFSTSYGDRQGSTQISTQKERVLTVGQLRQLRQGQGALFYRALPPAIVTLQAWWEGKDKQDYEDSRAWVLEREGFTRKDAA